MKYFKKGIVVEAWKYDLFSPMPIWLCEAFDDKRIRRDSGSIQFLLVETLEGTMRANPGDWIIKGVKGEIYPCKPDIFEATYRLWEERDEPVNARRDSVHPGGGSALHPLPRTQHREDRAGFKRKRTAAGRRI